MAPKDVHGLIPGLCDYTLCGKRAVADVIKLKVLKLLSWIIQMGTKYHHKSSYKRKVEGGTSLVVQLLSLQASTAGGTGSISGQGSKIPHAAEKLKPEYHNERRPTHHKQEPECHNQEPAQLKIKTK